MTRAGPLGIRQHDRRAMRCARTLRLRCARLWRWCRRGCRRGRWSRRRRRSVREDLKGGRRRRCDNRCSRAKARLGPRTRCSGVLLDAFSAAHTHTRTHRHSSLSTQQWPRTHRGASERHKLGSSEAARAASASAVAAASEKIAKVPLDVALPRAGAGAGAEPRALLALLRVPTDRPRPPALPSAPVSTRPPCWPTVRSVAAAARRRFLAARRASRRRRFSILPRYACCDPRRRVYGCAMAARPASYTAPAAACLPARSRSSA